MRCTEAQLETLSTALDAFNRVDCTPAHMWTLDDGMALPRLESRLYGAAVACGMSRDEPSVSEWASARIAEWLLSAPLTA